MLVRWGCAGPSVFWEDEWGKVTGKYHEYVLPEIVDFVKSNSGTIHLRFMQNNAAEHTAAVIENYL